MSEPIRATLYNRTTKLVRPYPIKLIDELTSYSVPGCFHMPQFHIFKEVEKIVNGKKRHVQQRVWDGRRHLLKKDEDTVPTGLWLAIRNDLEVREKDKRIYASEWYTKYPFNTVLIEQQLKQRFKQARDYQIAAAAQIILNANTGGLILQATGSGKTYLAGMVFNFLLDTKCLFVVDELTLLRQARAELKLVTGEEIGFVGESKYITNRITVATIQTVWLHRHDPAFKKWLSEIDLLVLDEIHSQMASRNFDVIEKLQPKAVYGLTATLEMKKKHVRLRAQALCGPVLYEYPLAQGVEEKRLSKVAVVRVIYEKAAEQFKGTRAYNTEYRKLVSHSKRRNDLIEAITRVCLQDDHKVIVFVERVAHIRILEARFDDLSPETVYGEIPGDARVKIQHAFEQGKKRLIIANKVFEKGINIRTVDVGIGAQAMKSQNKAMQALGRLTRLADNKRYALYFDISDKENRFEKAAKRRYTAFKRNSVPVIRVDVPDGDISAWYTKVVQKVEQMLDIPSESDSE